MSGRTSTPQRRPRSRRTRSLAALASLPLAAALLAEPAVASGAPTAWRAPGVVSAAPAFTFQVLDDPADPTFNQLLGINDIGRIAGYYGSGASPKHPNRGYTISAYTGGVIWLPENYPGSAQTQVTALNDFGKQVGFWVDPAGNNAGFWVQRGQGQTPQYHTVMDPLAAGQTKVTQLLGMNNQGTAVGFYNDAAGNSHAFRYVLATGRYIPITVPGATSVQATGINDQGTVVGTASFANRPTVSFVLSGTTMTVVAVPGASATSAFGINDKGQVVGTYTTGKAQHGFVWHAGRAVTVDAPGGAGTTTVNGINNLGDLVGFYTDTAGNTIGFEAAPTYPLYAAEVPGA